MPPKVHTKKKPLSTEKYQSIGYAIYSTQEWNPRKILYLTLMRPYS